MNYSPLPGYDRERYHIPVPYTTYVMLNTEYYKVKETRTGRTLCNGSQVITIFCCTPSIPYDKVSTMKAGDTVNMMQVSGTGYSEHCTLCDNFTLCYLIPCSMVQSIRQLVDGLTVKVRVRIT
jgi:hypothetical protein